MNSNNELKELDIQNRKYYCFDYIIKFEDFGLDDIRNYFSVNKISCKTLVCAKPLHIRFDKIYGFIRVYVGTRYLVLFDSEIYDLIYYRIRYLTGVESGITYVVSHNDAKIKVASSSCLSLEKTLTLNNVIIVILFNKDNNDYLCYIFLEKSLNQLPENNGKC